MNDLKVGDIVARKSYGLDILFKVVDINNRGDENILTLKGICYRILADAPESDLILQSDQRISEHKLKSRSAVERKCRDVLLSSNRVNVKKMNSRNTPKDNGKKFSRPGNVLHLDGDNDYLDTCLGYYKNFGIDAVGRYIQEKNQAGSIFKLLQEIKPDILVLTGHDGVLKGDKSYQKIDNYRNSKYYVESVKEARRFEGDFDSLVIFAGACQSMFSEIIKAGANFASSPNRVLIHALDPVFICQKISFTGIDQIVKPIDAIGNTITGAEGIGGIQTRGKYREGYPTEAYK